MFRLSNKKALSQGLKCKVQLLVPGEEIDISYSNNSTGQDILNEVARSIDLLDKDYYGLKLYDHIQWIDLTKPVVKQTKGISNVLFALKFKYYPAEPALLANESTRYYLYLQLRADLLDGRLRSDSDDTLAYLIACVLQSELGDANDSPEISHKENYVAEFKFVPNQTVELELAAIALHQSEDFLGLRSADVELNFLKKACQLETYGIDPCPVKDSNSKGHFLLGVNYTGISTFQDSKRTNLFVWNEIERISIEGKLVLVYHQKFEKKKKNKVSKNRSIFAFRCPSQEHAENFWKISNEHRFFFTLDTTPESPIKTNAGGLFKKNHTLKYVGRVERDLLRDHVDETRSSGVRRSRSLMAKSNNGPMWQGFKQGNDLQTSMTNIYASEDVNKTYPSNMNYLWEEEEEEEEEEGPDVKGDGQLNQDSSRLNKGARSSVGSVSKEPTKSYNRKSVLTSKSEVSSNAVRRGSQVYMDTDQEKRDFIRASLFLISILSAIFITLLLINDADRPNSITYLLEKLNLKEASSVLRQNYFLPLKSSLSSFFNTIITALDTRLL